MVVVPSFSRGQEGRAANVFCWFLYTLGASAVRAFELIGAMSVY